MGIINVLHLLCHHVPPTHSSIATECNIPNTALIIPHMNLHRTAAYFRKKKIPPCCGNERASFFPTRYCVSELKRGKCQTDLFNSDNLKALFSSPFTKVSQKTAFVYSAICWKSSRNAYKILSTCLLFADNLETSLKHLLRTSLLWKTTLWDVLPSMSENPILL